MQRGVDFGVCIRIFVLLVCESYVVCDHLVLLSCTSICIQLVFVVGKYMQFLHLVCSVLANRGWQLASGLPLEFQLVDYFILLTLVPRMC